MTVYLLISLPKIPSICTVCKWFWPTLCVRYCTDYSRADLKALVKHTATTVPTPRFPQNSTACLRTLSKPEGHHTLRTHSAPYTHCAPRLFRCSEYGTCMHSHTQPHTATHSHTHTHGLACLDQHDTHTQHTHTSMLQLTTEYSTCRSMGRPTTLRLASSCPRLRACWPEGRGLASK